MNCQALADHLFASSSISYDYPQTNEADSPISEQARRPRNMNTDLAAAILLQNDNVACPTSIRMILLL